MNDFYSKRLKRNVPSNVNENQERQQRSSAPNPSKMPDKPKQQQRSTDIDDVYMAQLLQRYGDADEAARRQWTQSEPTYRPQQFPGQSQANFETDVRTSSTKHI